MRSIESRPVEIALKWDDQVRIAFIVIGANGIVRGEKVPSLARCRLIRAVAGPSPWRTIRPALEDYLAPFQPRAECFHSLA